MPEFSTKRRVRHAAADMFDLVADVKKYPEFVPLCSALTVKSRNEKDDGTIVLVADMERNYPRTASFRRGCNRSSCGAANGGCRNAPAKSRPLIHRKPR